MGEIERKNLYQKPLGSKRQNKRQNIGMFGLIVNTHITKANFFKRNISW